MYEALLTIFVDIKEPNSSTGSIGQNAPQVYSPASNKMKNTVKIFDREI